MAAPSIHSSRPFKAPRERKPRQNIKLVVKNMSKLETKSLAVFSIILLFFICAVKFITVLSTTTIYLIEGDRISSTAEEGIELKNEGIESRISSGNDTVIKLQTEFHEPEPPPLVTEALPELDVKLPGDAINNKPISGDKFGIKQEVKSNSESDARETEYSSSSTPQLEEIIEVPELKSKLTCDDKSKDDGFPYARPFVCQMSGDVRISPGNSSVTVIGASRQANEERRIRPYARQDDALLPGVKEVILKSVSSESEAPSCTWNYDVPAVVFSIGGYTGNFFHDMSDVLIPLYLTSFHLKGEVQYFITNYKQWWYQKYKPVLRRLSHYDIINFGSDMDVHCFRNATLGLVRDRDLIIHPHPTRNPKGYSMVDFTSFLRHSYGLKKDKPMVLGQQPGKKPKMLIISRKVTRKFVNLQDLVAMSQELGFDVVVSEAGGNVKRFATLVNSCDVMLGVHGAGLTNQIFLPTRAVLIQIVPWGKMDWMATNFYGQPARDMDLKYLEYNITEEESSLVEKYSKDDDVFKNPMAIHAQGWKALADIIMTQDVRLDLLRFRPTLLDALDILQE